MGKGLKRSQVKFTKNFEGEPKGYYVYIHKRSSNGTTFYVGKGCRDRYKQTDRLNKHWQNIAIKHGITVEIVKDNLQEWYAYELETETISLYGRLDLGYGPLVNYSDGGEGTSGHICTEEYRNKKKLLIGELAPSYDPNLYIFKNFKTNKTLHCTKYEFYKQEGVKYAQLTRNKNGRASTSKCWYLPDQITSEELEMRAYDFKGEHGVRTNHKIYDFTNVFTLETIKCKGIDFLSLKGLDLTGMIRGVNNVSYGWTLTERISSIGLEKLRHPNKGIFNPNIDNKLYTFINLITDEVFKGTRSDFESQFKMSIEALFYVTRARLVSNHWCLLENKNKAIENSKVDYNKYLFSNNETGETFYGTRVEFKSKYNINVKTLFNSSLKQRSGWNILS